MRNLLPTSAATRGAPWVTRALFKRSSIQSAACKVGLLGLLTAGTTLSAQAQFPVNEAFTGTTATNFTLGGNATLTGTSTTNGYLRLTNNTGNQAGYAILNGSFPAPSGFSISFEFFSYGGTGADGISVFLVDAAGTNPKPTTGPSEFTIGAYGGSLGYAQKTLAGGATDINGATKGYLGIGIDEYGNFATSGEGRVGGSTALIPQSVTLRGPGTGLSNYQYLTSSGTLPFTLNVGTVEAQPTSADYRKAFIYVIPQTDGTYKITVRIQHGPTAVATTTYNYSVATPPSNLRVGFAGSTGGQTDYHEIRNLAIVQNPIAIDDAAQTRYPSSSTVTFSVVANDKLVGTNPSPLNPATVDLDPSTTTVDKTLTVAGKGTFSVDNNGNVTFTPSGTFSGVVSIPYAVADITGALSNPATINVTVTGADVATSVSGPASASPGSQITYNVVTTNNGVETATNVQPTLQLPAGLTIPASAGYTYAVSTGLVTFNQTTLAAGAAISNSITFNVPASGTASITAVSGYTYPTGATVPDAVTTNNTASTTTTIAGSATIATDCSTPGKDGPATLSATATPNTYYPGVSVATLNGGISTISVGAASGGTTAIAAGDLVLVMQMQGATIDETNTTTYGIVTTTTSTAGKYEYATVTSVTGSPISTITLNKALTNTYNASGTNQNFQVIRVPQYSFLTVNGVVTGSAWNSLTKVGGVLALDVAGATTFSGAGAGLSMTSKGFNGGGGKSYTGSTTTNTTDYATTAAGAHGAKGEGVAGTPRNFYTGSSLGVNTVEGYAPGSNNKGAPANAGGGAQDFTPNSNAGNSGGGGGGNLAVGGIGGFGFGSGASGSQAFGGRAFTGSAKILIMGGGGGAGSSNDAAAALSSSGGVGGGIVMLRTGTTSGTATIEADGSDAPSTAANAKLQGGGGGGAGGTILLLTTPATGTSNLTGLSASAAGGNGGTVNNNVRSGSSYGPGGGGSGGAVYASSTLTTTVTGGANGTTSDGKNNPSPIAYGATAGAASTPSLGTTAANTSTIGGAGSCIPALSVALNTSTPNVTRTAGVPKPATYTATVSNTGGTAQNSSVTITMDPLFTYDNTFPPNVTLTTANGTTTTLPAGSYAVSGTSSLVFSGINIPSGNVLTIIYRATISASAVNDNAYQSSSTITFTDPTRTLTSSGLATPGNPFASGGGNVPGTNYAAASGPNEDVTIVAPLPVVLTSFDVLAVRQDALLTWATASEQNNDHFVVERSVTGTDFVAVGTVRGQGTSVHAISYTFTDAGVGRLASSTVYYRLRPVAVDGTSTFSPVRTVKFAAAAKAAAALYPNPSQGQTTLDLSSLATGTYSVQVLDLAGRVLRTQEVSSQITLLDLAGLPQGAYLVLLQGVGVRQALPLLRN